MAQQIDFEPIEKPIDFEPISAPAPEQGVSHGAVIDSLWNYGKSLIQHPIDTLNEGLLPQATTDPMQSGRWIRGADGIARPNPNPGIIDPLINDYVKPFYNETIQPLSSIPGIAATLMGIRAGQTKVAQPAEELTIPSKMYQPAKPTLALPPHEPEPFIAGPPGTGVAVPGDVNPLSRVSNPARTPYATSFDPAELREQNRIRDLKYTNEPNVLHTTEQPKAPATVETGLGFQEETNPEKSLGYPLDIVPNRLRPRNVQSVINNLIPDTIKRLVIDERGELDTDKLKSIDPDLAEKVASLEKTLLPSAKKSWEIKSENEYVKGVLERHGITQSHTPEAIGDMLDKADPKIANGDVIKPPPDIINAEPVEPKVPSDLNIPRAGQAKPTKDISALESNLGSAHTVLLSRPESEGIARPILDAQDRKLQWVRSTLDEASQYVKGLSKPDRIAIGKMLDSGNYEGANPVLVSKVEAIRNILDSVHEQFPEGIAPGGKDVGYLENYFTHIQKQEPDFKAGVGSILKYYFGKDSAIHGLFGRDELAAKEGHGIGDLFERGLGDPSSPYIKERKGNLTDLDFDINRVLPAYVESAGRVIFDKPAVDSAKMALARIPEGSKLKELGQWYIKNYTRYDAEPELHHAWNRFATIAATTTARSFIDWNIGLHALHAGEVPANIWPELGTKYSTIGLTKIVKEPIKTWTEMARLGLIQGETKPSTFKTLGEKYQSASYFLNAVERYVKGIGYAGAKQKFLDQGLSENEASLKAVQLTKDMTMTVDPARQMKGLSPESNIMGGEVGSKLGSQFKGIPAKIAEQYIRIAANAKQDKKKAARMAAGAASMIGATALGAHTFHLNPGSLISASAFGAFGTAMGQVYRDLMRGDAGAAMMDLAAWLTPGGQMVKKGVKVLSE